MFGARVRRLCRLGRGKFAQVRQRSYRLRGMLNGFTALARGGEWPAAAGPEQQGRFRQFRPGATDRKAPSRTIGAGHEMCNERCMTSFLAGRLVHGRARQKTNFIATLLIRGSRAPLINPKVGRRSRGNPCLMLPSGFWNWAG